jgi:hypothetical protein
LRKYDITPEGSQLLNPANALRFPDPRATAFALANSLGIPSDELPCIVVSNDFTLDQFRWFKTSTDKLENDLTELGYLAARGAHLQSINLSGAETGQVELSLAKTLSDVLSFIIPEGTGAISERARNQARDAILALYSRLRQLKTDVSDRSEQLSEELEQLCERIVAFIAQTSEAVTSPIDVILTLAREWLEPESIQILLTAGKVMQMLLGGRQERLVSEPFYDRHDYTPAVICLAKVFEREANLSIVHWARQESGIELPRYFNIPQKGANAVVKTPKEVNLNMENRRLRGRWLPPGIGESLRACKKLGETKLPTSWDRSSWARLLVVWDEIAFTRNEAAHTDVVGPGALASVKARLDEIADNGFLERFYRMKQQYRGVDLDRPKQPIICG